MVVVIIETVEGHSIKAKSHAASVAPRLKHWSLSLGQSYFGEQRLIVMESDTERSTVFFYAGTALQWAEKQG